MSLWFYDFVLRKSLYSILCLSLHSGGPQFRNWEEFVNIIPCVGASEALLPCTALEFLLVRFINHSPSAPNHLCPDHHRSHSRCCNSNYVYFYHLSWFSVTHNDLHKDVQSIYSLQGTQQCEADCTKRISLFSLFVLHPFVCCAVKHVFAALLNFPDC